MKISAASHSDIDEAVGCLAKAFAQDPITGFLLKTSQGYRERVTQASNVGFYERAGFAETGRGNLGDATLWCMYLPHQRR